MTLSGRGAPVESILDIVEPTITTVPIRIKVSRDERIEDGLRRLQGEWSEIIDYKQAGLNKIKSYEEACRDACSFQNLPVIQGSEESLQNRNDVRFDEVADDLKYFKEYALMIVLSIQGSTANAAFSFDSNVVDREQVTRYAHHLEYLIDTIDTVTTGNTKTIAEIYPASFRDIVAQQASPKSSNTHTRRSRLVF